MDEISQKVEEIVANAPNWTFESDNSLLELMQMISKNLEQKATATAENLKNLNYDVGKTAISLDNTTNSLTALQFGQQYVESRCREDDDILEKPSQNQQGEKPIGLSSEEVLKTILKNNLEMLHKCHEKYSVNLEDSDDEASYTCIYRPRNPYNDRLLPYIYGTKEWQDNWHIGLCDEEDEENSNSLTNSSDEKEDSVYSVSNTSNLSEPIESSESVAGNLSDWPSNVSLNQNLHQQQPQRQHEKRTIPISIQNAADTSRNQYQPSSITSKASSSNESFESRNVLSNSNTNSKRNFDLFADIRTTPPSTPSQSILSQKYSTISPSSSLNSIHKIPTNVPPNVPPIDFITEKLPPKEIPTPTPSSLPDNSNKNLNKGSLRRPVNLFDDDDFNNFMSEINSKVHNKISEVQQENIQPNENIEKEKSLAPIPKPRTQPSVPDLFADDYILEDSAKTKSSITPKALANKQPSLDVPDNVKNKSLDLPKAQSSATSNISKFSTKSLFDDDDNDDDFLNIFMKKPSTHSITQKKTNLFDDLEDETLNLSKDPANLFDKKSTEVYKEDKTLNLSKEKPELFEDKPKETYKENKTLNFSKEQPELFDNKSKEDCKEDKTLNLSKDQANLFKPVEPKEDFKEVTKPSFVSTKTNLFDSDNDEDDDIFTSSFKKTTKPKQIQEPTIENIFADKSKEDPIKNKTSLLLGKTKIFDDLDSDNEDLFGTSNKQKTPPNPPSSSALKAKEENDLFSGNSSLINEEKSKEENSSKPEVKGNETLTTNEPEKPLLKILPEQPSLDFDEFDEEEEIVGPPQKLLEKSFQKKEVSSIKQTLPEEEKLHQKELPMEDQKRVEKKRRYSLFFDSEDDEYFDSKLQESFKVQSKHEDHSEKPKEMIKSFALNEENNSTPSLVEDNQTNQESFKDPVEKNLPKSNFEEGQSIETLPEDKKQPETLQEQKKPEVVSSKNLPLEEEKGSNISAISSSPPLGSQTYMGLFPDEPPDDHDLVLPQDSNARSMPRIFEDFYEPQKTITPKEDPSNVPDYKGIRLFNDLPPDDEFEASPIKKESLESKRLHSIFYDDFQETKEALKQRNKPAIPAQHAFFDDEPPSDEDLLAKPSSKQKENESEKDHLVQAKESQENVKDSSTEKGPSSTTSPSTIEALKAKLQEPSVVTKEPIKSASIAKLKLPKMDINVKALIPAGPGQPAFKKSPSSQPSSNEQKPLPNPETKEQPLQPSKPEANSQSLDPKDSHHENILSNLCKDRVRAPAKRKPSSRLGRRESYRKTLLAQEEEERKAQADLASILSSQTKAPTPIKATVPKLLFADSSEDELDDLFDKKPVLKKNLKDPNLNNFISPPDDDLFSPDNNFKRNILLDKNSSDNSQESSYFSNPGENSLNHLLNNSNKSLSETMSSKHLPDKLSDKTIHLDEPDKFITPSQSSTTTKKSSSKSLFSESSSESDDDLFKSINKTSNKLIKTPNVTSTQEPPKTTKAIAPPVKKPVSLFDSDSADEDPFQKPSETKSLNRKPLPDKTSKGLFSDVGSDDDDDLFGGTSTKKVLPQQTARTVTTNTLSKSTITKTTATIKQISKSTPTTTTAKDLQDNPLADLLK